MQDIIEIADEKLGSDEGLARQREAERLRKATPPQAYRIAMTERGDALTSEGLAETLSHLDVQTNSSNIFAVVNQIDPNYVNFNVREGPCCCKL